MFQSHFVLEKGQTVTFLRSRVGVVEGQGNVRLMDTTVDRVNVHGDIVATGNNTFLEECQVQRFLIVRDEEQLLETHPADVVLD
jgi:hypothetical protein